MGTRDPHALRAIRRMDLPFSMAPVVFFLVYATGAGTTIGCCSEKRRFCQGRGLASPDATGLGGL